MLPMVWFGRTLIIGAMIGLFTSPGAAQSRQDSAEKRDGVVERVANNSEARNGAQDVKLREIWRVGGEDDDNEELPIFGMIGGVECDVDGNVYVLDKQLSHIVVLAPDGRFLRTIGRKGEGPGDVSRPSLINMLPNDLLGVFMGNPTRIAIFDRSGVPVGTTKLPEWSGVGALGIAGAELAGDHLVLHAIQLGYVDNEEIVTHYLCSTDFEGNEIVRYYEEEHSTNLEQPVWEERSKALWRRWAARADGSVVVASSFSEYEISAFAPNGNLRQLVTRKYDHRKRSSGEKKAVYDWASWNPDALWPNTRFEIEEYDKDIMSLHIDPQGSCWIPTSRGLYDRPKGSAGVYDVIGPDGKLDRQVTLRANVDPIRDSYYFIGGRLLVATGYRDAIVAQAGSRGSNVATDPEPMSLVCFGGDYYER
jgi:hypothetical protein